MGFSFTDMADFDKVAQLARSTLQAAEKWKLIEQDDPDSDS